ncbi:MADS-box transcription factor 23-like [Rhododendron vialii]|uniref:MADS-box transcription factor 23-like n=1 Tax=Rhododendron vialii TaxID=182163 RepID=UPI00265ED33D|nr:MADS-box transcription factor 23-like [Rhododendron vialii]
MGTGKKKIEIKMREKGEQRMVTFSKRRQGLFKKAYELHRLTGAHVASVVFSPTGRPYVHGNPSFDATIDRYLNIMINNTISSSASTATATGSSSSCHVEDQMINGGDDIDSGGGANGKMMMMMLRSCLEGMRVEDYWNVEELVVMKEKMGVIRGKVVQQIENEFTNIQCEEKVPGADKLATEYRFLYVKGICALENFQI